MYSKSLTLTLTIIILISIVAIQPVMVKAQTKAIIVPDNYSTIQAAINNASTGDSIFVRSGTYNENISINKSINLIGQNSKNTILASPLMFNESFFPGPTATYEINVHSDKVSISNFTIANGNINGSGINSKGNDNQINDVIMNSIHDSGITIDGSNQLISQNYIANASTGVKCSISSTGNQIIGNIFLNCGVDLNGFENRIISNSISNLGEISIFLHSNSNVIQNNTLTGTIYLTNANSNFIYINKISGALDLGDPQNGPASNNLIAGNTIESAVDWGVLIGYGSNNVFYGNLIANNGGYGHDGDGLAFGGTAVASNLFYCNMFVNNTVNFEAKGQVLSSNSFDNGSVGNYWDVLNKIS